MDIDFPRVEYRQLGRTGEKVSEIGLGTYGINDYNKAEVAFAYALEMGINFIDTAEIYNTEDFVGRVIKRAGRENLFITTKVWPNNMTSRESTLKAARGSLNRLGINYVDLILIHWPNDKINIADQVKNIESVQKEGLSRYIGVSNFSVKQMEEARRSTSSTEIVCNQVKYNLEERESEKDVIPYCIRNGMSVVAYTPISKGKSSKSAELKEISKSTGRTPIQVALNFLLGGPGIIPIPKTENIEHMKEILGSTGWKLDAKQIELLRKL